MLYGQRCQHKLFGARVETRATQDGTWWRELGDGWLACFMELTGSSPGITAAKRLQKATEARDPGTRDAEMLPSFLFLHLLSSSGLMTQISNMLTVAGIRYCGTRVGFASIPSQGFPPSATE
jgi:hypothetical protein